ncbi:hypothetical protein BX666DRAFT_1937727 [Dichotomocladium elegans]|nr:hypothetical protein BX666DRAFT_1937727 [Dichotomocladium elegans]
MVPISCYCFIVIASLPMVFIRWSRTNPFETYPPTHCIVFLIFRPFVWGALGSGTKAYTVFSSPLLAGPDT